MNTEILQTADCGVRSEPIAATPSAPAAKPAARIITDLAEVKRAITKCRRVALWVFGEKGELICIISLSKKEAHYRAVEQDKFDSYAAKLNPDGTLWLNERHQPELRLQRAEQRRATRHALLLERKAKYERTNLAVPALILQEIAATAPATPVAA